MAAVVFPQEAVAKYVKQLLGIAGDTARDASTLTRQAPDTLSGSVSALCIG